ncbi:hypothetical protein HAX54_029218 [Datura stramonium]|uniref:Uncharacterized protein n=1 Tax=Datura stramonium TaxID=4076 RepID=A0ABS8V6X1_DATST|nr:hypothetical protein [Datura stramonium]
MWDRYGVGAMENEGQLGLGSRIKIVASPHLIPCLDTSSHGLDGILGILKACTGSQTHKALGSYIKRIACGGRHSTVITDVGVLLTFGWGLYGQTSPRLVDAPILENKNAKVVSCGARHSAIMTGKSQDCQEDEVHFNL